MRYSDRDFCHVTRFTTTAPCDDIRGFEFALSVKVGINVARRTYIGMPEPFLDHLHRHLFRKQKRRAGMPQLMELNCVNRICLS